MGTMLFANGLLFGDPPEVWNLSKPDVIRRIHRGYLDAGSQILMTNTFGGNRMRLSLHGLQDRVAELNQTAAILARSEVEAAGGTALVAGDIGPSGAILAPTGTLDYDEAVDIFAEQAAALVAGGVDLIWIETMSDLREIQAAIEGVRRVSPGIALITTMTFDTRGHTMMGVSPEQAVASLSAWGADAVGGNCGNGPDELITVIERMRAADPNVRLVAKSNAGMPELVDMRAVYRADPATMAAAALRMRTPVPRSSAAAAATRRSISRPSRRSSATDGRRPGRQPMSEWIYFIHPPREDFAATMTDEERAVWGIHFERFERLLAEGTIILVGPTLGETNTGIAIFEAPDEAAARRIMDEDPVLAGGFARGELRPFRVSLLRGRDG